MEAEDVSTTNINLIDHNVPLGIFPDMTARGWDSDEWPALFNIVTAADILIVRTPIWLGA